MPISKGPCKRCEKPDQIRTQDERALCFDCWVEVDQPDDTLREEHARILKQTEQLIARRAAARKRGP